MEACGRAASPAQTRCYTRVVYAGSFYPLTSAFRVYPHAVPAESATIARSVRLSVPRYFRPDFRKSRELENEQVRSIFACEASRALLRQRFVEPVGLSLKALLASAPLEGIDLDRSRDLGRDVDL